jgi:hypothetical protein
LGLAALRPAGAVLVSLRLAGAVLGFLGLAGAVLLVLGPPVVVPAALGPHHLLLAPKLLFADQEQMLKALATRGLPSLLWSALGPAARRWQYLVVAVLHRQTVLLFLWVDAELYKSMTNNKGDDINQLFYTHTSSR